MNRKHWFSSTFVVAMMSACASQAPSDQFTLKGTVSGMDGKYMYLSYTVDTVKVMDSVLVKDGTFEFKGKLSFAADACLCSGWNVMMAPDGMKKVYNFFIDPAEMTLVVDTADYRKSKLTGSLTQAQVDSLTMQQQAIWDEAKPIVDAMNAETDHEKQAELREQLSPYQERIGKLYKAFIVSHPSSVASARYLLFESSGMEYEELKDTYEGLSDAVKNTAYAKEVADELLAQERVMPGKPAPEFAAVDVNGDSIRLSDFRGKYVILDFWASWCVPCRKSNPHMKELYKKYGKKGLDFIYIGDNDSSPDEWKEAIKKDGIEMFHHVLRGMKIKNRSTMEFDKTNDISDKYGIHYLPTKYLIDPDGKILGRFENDELDKKLKEIFGF